MSVIPFHGGPGFFVPVHTPEPEIESARLYFASDAEGRTQVGELVAVELEVLPRNLERVHRLVRTWRF